MRTEVFADGRAVELNTFFGQLLGNVAVAAVRSLHSHAPSGELEFNFDDRAVQLTSDGQAVFLNPFVIAVFRDLFRALLSHVKGTSAAHQYRLTVKEIE